MEPDKQPAKEYVGVWIPAEITEREDLSPLEKWLWAEIAGYRECWASNAFLAKRMGVSENWISQEISKLMKLGLLEKVGFNGRFRIIKVSLPQNSKADYDKTQRQTMTKIKPENKVENKEENKKYIMSAPVKPAPTREIPQEAIDLANYLHDCILTNKPDRKIPTGWQKRWAEDIERMHRLDNRSWQAIRGCITWSQNDDFWRQNILSGEKLRKHYDRMSDRARQEREKHASQDIANAIFNMSGEEAIEYAKRNGIAI